MVKYIIYRYYMNYIYTIYIYIDRYFICIISILVLRKLRALSKATWLERVNKVCFKNFCLLKSTLTVKLRHSIMTPINIGFNVCFIHKRATPNSPRPCHRHPSEVVLRKAIWFNLLRGQKFLIRFSDRYSWNVLKPGPCSCHGKSGHHGKMWRRGMTERKSTLLTDVLSVLVFLGDI